MKINEIKSLSEENLKKKMGELNKELIKLNAEVATGTNPKSPGQIRVIKKTIARIKTVMNETKNSTEERKQG